MRLQVAYEKIHLNKDVKVCVWLSLLCVIWCVCNSPVCVETDTRRHQVEFVLVPFCRISPLFFFLFVFFSYGREESWPSLSQRDANLSLSLTLSVFCRRSAVTGRADCWRRAVWALFSTHTHTHTLVHAHYGVTQHTNTQRMHMHELCVAFHPLLMNSNI